MQGDQVDKPRIIQGNILRGIVTTHYHDLPIAEIATCRTIKGLWSRSMLLCPGIGCYRVAIDVCYALLLFRIQCATHHHDATSPIRSKNGIASSHRQWGEYLPLILGDVVAVPARSRECMGTEYLHKSLGDIE